MKIQELIDMLQDEARITPHATVRASSDSETPDGDIVEVENNGIEITIVTT